MALRDGEAFPLARVERVCRRAGEEAGSRRRERVRKKLPRGCGEPWKTCAQGRVRCGGVRCPGPRRSLGLPCGLFTDEKTEVKREEGPCRKPGSQGKVQGSL